MPVIVYANSKGGAGKSTSSLVLAQVLAEKGAEVTLLDADPNQPLDLWAKRDPNNVPDRLHLVTDVTEKNIIDHIDTAAAKHPFVIIDTEGTANLSVGYAIGRADLVVIPMQGSQLDADQAARVIDMISQQAKAFRREIPFVIMFTKTSAIRGRDFKHIEKKLAERGIPMLDVEMKERAAYRTIMQLGGTIYNLTKDEVTNPEAAIENAEAVANAIIAQLKAKQGAAA
jgi:chromosome partitioning protein